MKSDPSSPLYATLSAVFDLILLNLIWIAFSLPVVTMGASTAALYYAIRTMVRDEGSPLRGFFAAFKRYLKSVTLFWMAILAAAAVIAADFYIISRYWNAPFHFVLLGLLALCGVLLMLSLGFLFPMFAESGKLSFHLFPRSFVLSLRFLPQSLIMAVLNLIPWVLGFFWLYAFCVTLPLWILIGFSLIAYINTLVFNNAQQKLQQPPNSKLS